MEQNGSTNDQKARIQLLLSLILGIGSLLLCFSGWYSGLGVVLGIVGCVLYGRAKRRCGWLRLQKRGFFRVCLLVCFGGVLLNSATLLAAALTCLGG